MSHKLNKYSDKIIKALGSNELDKLSNELSLKLEKRLLSLLYLNQGNATNITTKQIQLEYLRIKDQGLIGSQQISEFNTNDIIDCL